MKKLYLSGPMQGYPEFNYPLFHEVTAALRESGFEIVSPAEMDAADNGETREQRLARDVIVIADPTVEGLAVLPGWRRSRGAVLEIRVAQALGKPCHELIPPARNAGFWVLGNPLEPLATLAGIAPSAYDTFRAQRLAPDHRADAALDALNVEIQPSYGHLSQTKIDLRNLNLRPGRFIPVSGDSNGFVVQDSGARQQFASGMQRDTTEGKIDYLLALDGPMFERYAALMTAGARKYDRRNWMKADGPEELERFRGSALRHMLKWLAGDREEDHAASCIFNLNGAEMVRDKMLNATPTPEPINEVRTEA